MTAIVGLVHSGAVWLGGDQRCSFGNNGSLIPSGQAKVWRCAGAMVVGAAGHHGWGNTLRYATLPTFDPAWSDPHDWLWREWLPAVREACAAAGLVGQDREDGRAAIDGEALIGIAGRLFELHGGNSLVECGIGMAAIGCGADLALGAMWARRTHHGGPDDLLRIGLSVAAEFNAYVAGPFDVVSTEARP